MKILFNPKYVFTCFLLSLYSLLFSLNAFSQDIRMPFEKAYSLYLDGDYINSIKKLEEILNDSTCLFNDEFSKGRIYQFIGANNMLIGDYEKALYFYNSAVEVSKNKINTNILPAVYINIANLYSYKGEFKTAIEYYNKALSSLSMNSKNSQELNYFILHNLGYLYNTEGDISKSVIYYKKAIDFGQNYKIDGVEESYNYCALAYQQLGINDSAEIFFKKSITKFKQGSNLGDLVLAHFYMNYGDFLIETGSFSDGLKYFKDSYRIYTYIVGDNHPAISDLFYFQGKYYLKIAQYNKALTYFQKSLVAKLPGFNDTSVFINPSVDKLIEDIQLVDILKNKALALSLLGETKNNPDFLTLSVKTYGLSINVIDNLRAGYLSEKSRLDLNRRERETLSSLVGLCYKLYKKTGNGKYKELAFKYSEKSKYAALQQNITDNQALHLAGVPDSLVQKELSLREKIGAYRKQLIDISMQQGPDQVLEKKVNNRLFDALRKREALIGSIEKQYPGYYKLKYSFPVATIFDVQQSLNKKDALIEYFFSDTLLYTFVITKKQSEIFVQTTDSSFTYWSQQFFSSLYSSYECDNELYRRSGYYLYKKLVYPLGGLIKNKNLIIVPDDLLTYFSFDAMLTGPYKDGPSVDYRRYPYLLYNHAISYAFSATLLAQNDKEKRKWRNSFTGYAPGSYNKSDSLQLLPGIEEDITVISKMLHGRAFIGKSATKGLFKKFAPGNDIIQVNTHSFVNFSEPMESKVYFEYIDSADNGYLYLYEMYGLDLDTKLMVLPACHTGFGRLNIGEGIQSIAQGIQRSGNCHSLLISMWETDNASSIDILRYFYKCLIKGNRKDIALQKAKIQFIENIEPAYAEPRFWANHVIIGNNSSLYINYTIKLIIIILPLLMLLFFLFNRKR